MPPLLSVGISLGSTLAVALAEAVRDYVAAIQAGKLSYTAHCRQGTSVVLGIWADPAQAVQLRQVHPFLLSDHRHQADLLACFLDDRALLEMPQPRGAVIPDTIQAMWQVYLYLDAAGSEVANRETDRIGLKLEGRSILDRIEAGCPGLSLRYRG